MITKRPENNTTGFADISYGNYGQKQYTAGIRTALIKDKLFFGAAGMYEGRNGFYTNEFNISNHYCPTKNSIKIPVNHCFQ